MGKLDGLDGWQSRRLNWMGIDGPETCCAPTKPFKTCPNQPVFNYWLQLAVQLAAICSHTPLTFKSSSQKSSIYASCIKIGPAFWISHPSFTRHKPQAKYRPPQARYLSCISLNCSNWPPSWRGKRCMFHWSTRAIQVGLLHVGVWLSKRFW